MKEREKGQEIKLSPTDFLEELSGRMLAAGMRELAFSHSPAALPDWERTKEERRSLHALYNYFWHLHETGDKADLVKLPSGELVIRHRVF